MESKAEERALEKYPIYWAKAVMFDGSTIDLDANERTRDVFKLGYKQAEKDLALSIEDLERLHTFLYAVKNNKQGCFTFTRLSNEQYEEVLRRFNTYKEGKKCQNSNDM